MREGFITFIKVDFIVEFVSIREKTFKKKIIIGVFINYEIISFNPYIIFNKIVEYKPHEILRILFISDDLNLIKINDFIILFTNL